MSKFTDDVAALAGKSYAELRQIVSESREYFEQAECKLDAAHAQILGELAAELAHCGRTGTADLQYYTGKMEEADAQFERSRLAARWQMNIAFHARADRRAQDGGNS